LLAAIREMAKAKPFNDYIAYLLAQANRQINGELDVEFRSEGIPVEQWRILSILAASNGRSMGELAQAALLNHPTLTKTIDRMISQALVYRRVDPLDRRKILIFISNDGKAVNERLNRLANSHQAGLIDSCGDSGAAELKRLLEGLIHRT
jgi:MarR family transcriptional regulator, organic hydroperoxide resistance regulator